MRQIVSIVLATWLASAKLAKAQEDDCVQHCQTAIDNADACDGDEECICNALVNNPETAKHATGCEECYHKQKSGQIEVNLAGSEYSNEPEFFNHIEQALFPWLLGKGGHCRPKAAPPPPPPPQYPMNPDPYPPTDGEMPPPNPPPPPPEPETEIITVAQPDVTEYQTVVASDNIGPDITEYVTEVTEEIPACTGPACYATTELTVTEAVTTMGMFIFFLFYRSNNN